MNRALFFAVTLFATAAAAEQVIPVNQTIQSAGTHDIRLRNLSTVDAATVTLAFQTDGGSASETQPIRIDAGQEMVLPDVVGNLFGLTFGALGEVRVHAPGAVEVLWRRHQNGSADTGWLPSLTVQPSAVRTRRRAVCSGCRTELPTLVKVGDTTSFAGSHGVSGTATIVDMNTIRLSGLRHDGSAPGLDLRVGLSTNSRRSFAVLRVTGRQTFQNAVLDVTLPQSVDLNSFDTFTVWCYEFNTVIAEGKFTRP